jgi:tRNA(Ile)-lysidine synthase TilS/MesJ
MIKFDKHLLDKQQEVYLGFSGGYDSLSLAYFLKRGGWNVKLLHVRHFDTDNSYQILNGVRHAAKVLDLQLQVITPYDLSAELYAFSKMEYNQTEAGAFIIRDSLIRSLPYKIVIAHTLNDLAETYFLNCLKGNPTKIPLMAVNGNKIRPILRTRRVDIQKYADKYELTDLVVPDSMANLRAVLRQQVFPVLNNDLTTVVYKMFINSGLIYDVCSN